jgi:hypothetical protein
VSEECPGKEFTILGFVEPGAFDVEKLEAWIPAGQRQSIDRELGDRLVGGRIRPVVQDVDGTVSDLQKVDVACDHSRCIADASAELDTVPVLERRDILLGEPDRDLDRNGDTVVREHEFLQGLVTQFVVADGWNDEGGRLCCSILRFTMMRETSANAGCA